MGVYNPYAPHILGQEWVPMRDEEILLSAAQDTREVGHTFVIPSSKVIQDARFYITDFPSGFDSEQIFFASVYAKGTEHLTGPIRSVIIPVNAGSISGAPASFAGGATTVAGALASPLDLGGVSFTTNATLGTTGRMSAFFAVDQYAPQLNGKRIVGVNLLMNICGQYSTMALTTASAQMLFANDSFTRYRFLGIADSTGNSMPGPDVAADDQVGNAIRSSSTVVAPLGEVNPFWSTSSPNSTPDRMPWTYTGLQAYQVSSVTVPRIMFELQLGPATGAAPNAGLYINYLAMQVLFCEETRLMVGGRSFGGDNTSVFSQDIIAPSTAILPMRSLSSLAANPVLAAGEYTLTVTQAETGNVFYYQPPTKPSSLPAPALQSVRELFMIPTHEGVQVNVTHKIGEVFGRETTHVLPQLSLHTSGGPLTEVHVYGRQAVAQVYGTITATQEILDSAALSAQTWPQVRFLARRFGRTTVPLTLDSPSIAGSSVSISPNDFDALTEIIDGWREVTLTFTTPPTMGAGTAPQWRWSATGETAGNRWEVLGAYAPAPSGIPGNLLNLVPTPNQLSIATYGEAVSGAQINLGWVPQYAPAVTATTDDQTADAFIIFAQDMPAVTGLSVSVASQAVTGIGLNCGLDPCCIPTSISYNWLTWSAAQLPLNVLSDDFERTLSDSWGTAPIAPTAWTNSGGAATDYDINGHQGTHLMTSVNVSRKSTAGSWLDGEGLLNMTIPVVATGAAIFMGMMFRFQDSSNYYQADLLFNTDNTVSIRLTARSTAGGTVTLVETVVGRYVAGDTWNLRAKIETMTAGNLGSMIYASGWPDGDTEPTFWQTNAFSAAINVAGAAGIRSLLGTGNTNTLNVTLPYNSFTMSSLAMAGYELQRMDTIDTTWQTIMLSDTMAITGFADYEARVGIASSYRIRQLDVYDFAGTWSSTVTSTIQAPGASGGCISDGHLLLFTSNERQDGSANLAYSSAWEGGQRVEEGFVFPEAGFNQTQAMYNRDNFVVFRPLERGGEAFTRTVLVQAAAISAPTLADFTDLRDMAWDTVNYICVRDEDGNRWFASVSVPNGRVQLNRSLYFAQVDVLKVTDTPTPVVP